MSSCWAIWYNFSREGWLAFVHHRLTVDSWIPRRAANHWLLLPFSERTDLILFNDLPMMCNYRSMLADKYTCIGYQFVPSNGYIVVASTLLMSARFSTFIMVIQITFMSVHRVQWSTYHTSNLNRSVQLMALRPWHCAHPDIPGLISCLLACSGE